MMGLINVHYDKFKQVDAVSSREHPYVQQFQAALKEITGMLPGKPVHLWTVSSTVNQISSLLSRRRLGGIAGVDSRLLSARVVRSFKSDYTRLGKALIKSDEF